jgi:ribosomal protein L40E
MAQVKSDLTVILNLDKREFTLISKALVGTLRDDEILVATELGFTLMKQFERDLVNKLEGATHAIEMAEKEVEANKNVCSQCHQKYLGPPESTLCPRCFGRNFGRKINHVYGVEGTCRKCGHDSLSTDTHGCRD